MGKVLRGQCDRQAIYDRPIHHYISFTSHVSTALLKHVFIIFQLPYPHFRKQGVLPPSLGFFMTNRETTKAPVKTTVNLFFRKDKE